MINVWVSCVCVSLTDRCNYEAMQLSHLRRHLETHEVQKRFACSQCDYSANTVSYLKIHQTRRHPPSSSSTPSILTQQQTDASGLQCHVCHYRFGNASDLKRHARLRHGLDSVQLATVNSADLVNNIPLTTISSLTPVCLMLSVLLRCFNSKCVHCWSGLIFTAVFAIEIIRPKYWCR